MRLFPDAALDRWRSAPVLLPLAAVAAGIELAALAPEGGPGLRGAGVVGLASVALARRSGRAATVGLLVALVFLSAHHARTALPGPRSRLARAAERELPILGLAGCVAMAPLIPVAASPDRSYGPPPRTTFFLDVDEVLGGRGPVAAPGRVLVRVTGVLSGLRRGDGVRVFGKLRPFPRQRNEGGIDLRAHWMRRGVVAWMSVPRPDAVEPSGDAQLGLRTRVARGFDVVRIRAWTAMRRHLGPRDAGVAAALLLGIRPALPRREREAFRRTGTMHFFAISGLHVALAAGGLARCMRWITRRRGRTVLVVAAFLVAYCGVTGAPPSAVRASTMLLGYAVARWAGRRTSFANILALAALVLLVANPWSLRDPGFLLSFTAVASIGIFGRERVAKERQPARAHSRAGRALCLAGRYARKGLRVSAAAWVGTLPITLALFHLVAPASFPGNLLILPVIASLLAVGLPAVALLAAFPDAAALAAPVLGGLASLASETALFLDRSLLHPVYLPAPTPMAITAYYGGLVFAAARLRRLACLALMGAAALYAVTLTPGAPDHPEVHVLDVGQGACSVIRMPDGRTTVVDAGSTTVGEVGRRIIAPALWATGVRRIDAIVLSHADADHVSGAADLLERFPVARILHPRGFGASRVGRRVMAEAARRGVPCIAVSRGATVLGDARRLQPQRMSVQILHPPAPWRAGASHSDNDASLVVALEAHQRRVLVCGDVEEAGIDTLMRRRSRIRAAVIVLPHHGAHAANLESLLRRVSPGAAILSARKGFAPPIVIGTLDRLGLPRLATWETGRVRIIVDEDQVRVSGFRGSFDAAVHRVH